MKFLVLVLAVVPIYATGDVFGDLLGREFHVSIDHVRERRQAQKYNPVNQAPAHIQQLLQAQSATPPLVHIPQQPVPRFGPPQAAQGPQYRPQPAYGGQQPNYRNPNGPQQAPQPQQPQYRPLPANYAQQIQQQSYAPQRGPLRGPQQGSKLPAHIQQLLQYQSNLGNAIP
ncbi:activating signal cointegrator 1 complex subunit 2 homolog [Hylaeus anthracinus]|uniref:activating signal cointegrator 1 complex subunit 2 homolog n=1 Tax=Hylaeus anthracinus TaxID=313031 RepID=UPI0023B8861E|nr:activating signal cointegrator 1 complex subunit 2 homolog [Hylaeus anthracinus]